jgi:hypothetical protein
MDSCLLCHGPGARQFAVDEAGRRGRLLHAPFGDDGLKVDDAREMVSLLQSAPLGIDLGVVIAGPMDMTKGLKSADALLKSIEQPNKYVQAILWATDIGGVKGTIRSRCLPVWCPATGDEPVDDELEGTARELLNAALNDQGFMVPGLVKKMKGKLPELLGEVADAMTVLLDNPKVFPLWERVRAVARWRNPTQMEVISAFLPRAP